MSFSKALLMWHHLQVGNAVRARIRSGGFVSSGQWALTNESTACMTHMGSCTDGGTIAFWMLVNEGVSLSSQMDFFGPLLRLYITQDSADLTRMRLVWISAKFIHMLFKSQSHPQHTQEAHPAWWGFFWPVFSPWISGFFFMFNSLDSSLHL